MLLSFRIKKIVFLLLTVICFLAYFGVSGVITLMVPYNELDRTAAVTMAFYQRGLKFMGTLIGIGACLGLIGFFVSFSLLFLA